ncbi:unnamed protein product [Paramecium pentaurelia]|uniref:Transmembrane protein n=1 Tax=Paramecium pentaurelia TaxID=43138 RepID=A0A8S1X7X0_9CILI|nr:unnamed protein product [Paramecium pentaurelia]
MRTLQICNPNTSIRNLDSLKQSKTFTNYTTNSETIEEFQNRQRDYDKLQKYPYHTKQTPKTLKKYQFSSAVNEIKEQFFQTRADQKYDFLFKDHRVEQQKRSIQTIADIFRKQKKVVQDKKVTSEQKKTQFNLLLILMIILPILCILTVLVELE